jgi:hypothetical protein
LHWWHVVLLPNFLVLVLPFTFRSLVTATTCRLLPPSSYHILLILLKLLFILHP